MGSAFRASIGHSTTWAATDLCANCNLATDLLASLHLEFCWGDVWVFEADPLHGVDVLPAGLLELCQGGVLVVLVEVLELLLGAGLDIILLGLDDRAVLACAPETSNPS